MPLYALLVSVSHFLACKICAFSRSLMNFCLTFRNHTPAISRRARMTAQKERGRQGARTEKFLSSSTSSF